MAEATTVTRAEAVAQGLRWYLTGKPCPKGHVAKRNVSNSECRACVDVKKAAKRKADPDKVRAKDRARAAANGESRRQSARASWLRHRDRRLAEDRDRHAANPGRKRDAANAWWRGHRSEHYARVHQRKERVRRAAPAWLTCEQRRAMTDLYKEARARSGEWHVDHICPLCARNSCGLHVPWNLQILSGPDNRRKSNRVD